MSSSEVWGEFRTPPHFFPTQPGYDSGSLSPVDKAEAASPRPPLIPSGHRFPSPHCPPPLASRTLMASGSPALMRPFRSHRAVANASFLGLGRENVLQLPKFPTRLKAGGGAFTKTSPPLPLSHCPNPQRSSCTARIASCRGRGPADRTPHCPLSFAKTLCVGGRDPHRCRSSVPFPPRHPHPPLHFRARGAPTNIAFSAPPTLHCPAGCRRCVGRLRCGRPSRASPEGCLELTPSGHRFGTWFVHPTCTVIHPLHFPTIFDPS